MAKPVARGKIIGRPYQGTHAKAFNERGGSDNWESENAVDIAVPVGTPIYAVTDGVIGPQFGFLGEGGRFAGLRLHLVAGANEYYYAHMSKFAAGIKPGAKVHAGQIIGYSGEANGVAHLHFAETTGDPVSFLKGDGSTPTPDQSTPPPTDGTQMPTVVPPTAIASPSDSLIGGSGVEMPGSVDYQIDPNHVASLWQTAAGSDMVSPETQQMVQNAQLAVGTV